MKRLTILCCTLMSFLFIFAQSSDHTSIKVPQVCGNIYKGDIGGEGIALAEFHFFNNGEYEFKLTYLGMTETVKGVYEQNNDKLKITPTINGKEINTIVDKNEYLKLMNFVMKNDPDAFMTIYAVNEMMYRPKPIVSRPEKKE